MITPTECELIEALDGATYDDLINDIDRYANLNESELNNFKIRHPNITIGLIRIVIEVADECPACLHRFVNRPNAKHSATCKLMPLLVPNEH